ncbi:hypothetical protein JYT51_01305 [Candidatus Amoebophilus asiaticus]|nr:hypothetical protein [Candidatus Amoebophilus asiaticus]
MVNAGIKDIITTGISLILFCAFPTYSQIFNFRNYSVEHGLAQSQVLSICEDSKGYLWVGTYGGGVSKFDGKTFVRFSDKEGLPNNIVYSIIEDKAGTIWMGTYGGGVCKFDGDTFVVYSENEGLGNNRVLCLTEDRTGDLWIGTYGGGLNRLDLPIQKNVRKQIRNFTVRDGLINNIVRSVSEDRNGNLWIGTDGGLSKMVRNGKSGSSFINFNTENGLSNNRILSIVEGKSGDLWLGTLGGGLNLFDGEKFTPITEKDGLPSRFIMALLSDQAGNLWIGTYGNGIYYLSNENIHHFSADALKQNFSFKNFTEENGLANNIVNTISEDKSGNIWIGTDGGGLSLYNGEAFVHYSNIIKGATVSILQDRSGNLWLGTYGNGVIKFNPEDVEESLLIYTKKNGLTNNNIWSLYEDSFERIWFGTGGNGLCIYDPTKQTIIPFENGLQNSTVMAILEDAKGNMWFGTNRGGVTKYDGTYFSHYNIENLNENEVKTIIEDKSGNLWFGTSGGGLSKYDGSTFTNYTIMNGLSSNTVMALLEDSLGNIWVGTYGGGISILKMAENFKTDNNTQSQDPILRSQTRVYIEKTKAEFSEWKYITTNDGLNDNSVVLMTFDENWNVWAGTNKGVNKIIVDNKLEVVKIKQYSKLEGFRGIECNQNAVCKDVNGNIWFGTATTLTKYNPYADNANTFEPETHITNLRLFFENTNWSEYADSLSERDKLPLNLELPYSQNHLTFDFVGISFKIPEKVRYQYMLEGLDANWSPPVKENFATYANLPPGEFTFKVKACNEDGVWNAKATTLKITITPPFWQTWWFYFILISATISAVIAIVNIRIRILKQEQRKLKKIVKARTRELRVAFKNLKRLEEFKDSMMGMIVHDLKNPLNSILGFSRQEPEKHIQENIYQAGRQMLNLVMNILDVQKFEDAEVKLNPEDISINTVIQEAVEQVDVLIKQKSLIIEQQDDTGYFGRFDHELIVRVLVNLLTNAIKYTNQGGMITITTKKISSDSKDMLKVIVTDTGIGIPPKKLNKIFNRYSQVSEKESGNIRSTGLGLSFCKSAVEAHGGKIGVASELEKGSQFYFTIPLGDGLPEDTKQKVRQRMDPSPKSINSKETKEKIATVIHLTEDHKKKIQPVLDKFKKLRVFQTTENLNLLKDIEDNIDPGLYQWKEEMQRAVLNCDSNKYDELLDKIKILD